jgi:hypothetical protein
MRKPRSASSRRGATGVGVAGVAGVGRAIRLEGDSAGHDYAVRRRRAALQALGRRQLPRVRSGRYSRA